MIERLSSLSPRAKALVLGALIVLMPVAGWLGYNAGYWAATH